MNKILLALIIIIVLAVSTLFTVILLSPPEDDFSIPEPGEINFTYYHTYSSDYADNFSIKFKEDVVTIVSRCVNEKTDEEFHYHEVEYNRSVGDDIWYPLMEGFLKKKGNDPRTDCQCLPYNKIQMVDIHENIVVHGEYNSHKFYVHVMNVFSRIWTDDEEIQNGYNNLNNLTEVLIENLHRSGSRYRNFIFTPQNESALVKDDNIYYQVGGGINGPHVLQISDFENENLSGDIVSIDIVIKYKTETDFLNENTLNIIYGGNIDTEYEFNMTESEVKVQINVTDKFDLQSVEIKDISLYYENQGGVLPTPIIYFDYIWIKVKTFQA
jgi:hypothetical protein